MSSPKITTWIACLAFLYAGIPGLAQEVRHSGTVVAYGNTGSLQAEGNYDEPPLFTADGQAALEQWLAENITYPTNGFENGLHGKVTVRFTVEPDGSLDGIEATAYDDAALAAEAVAALHRSPRWLPGRKGGEPVAVTVTLPVSFRNAIRPKEAVFAAGDSQPADFMGGGLIAFRSWVMSNLEYPTAAYDNNIEGTVVVHFVIDTEGCLTDTHVVASPHSSLTREVLRVLRMSPQWEPARQDGKTVLFRYSLPVIFSMHGTTSGAYTRIGSPTW